MYFIRGGVPNHSPVIIHAASDLQEILGTSNGVWIKQKPRLLIRVRNVPVAQGQRWEAQLEELRSDCGCTAGAITVAVYSTILVLFCLTDQTSPPTVTVLERFAGWMVGLMAVGCAGKAVGIYRARARYRRVCLEILKCLQE